MIDSFLNIINTQHLFFFHLLLGGYGIILAGICFFEGEQNVYKFSFAPSSLLISFLCYVISIMSFYEENSIHFFYLIKIIILILIITSFIIAYCLNLGCKKKPYHISVIFTILCFLFYSVLCGNQGYFDTFYPIAFVLIILSVFSSKYHVWSFTKILQFYCVFLILFLPSVILYNLIALYLGFNMQTASFISISGYIFIFPFIVFSNLARNILYRKLYNNINIEKNLYKNLIDETTMNPFASGKSILSSFFKNMKNVGEFELLSILLLEDEYKNSSLMRENFEDWQKKIEINNNVLEKINIFKYPFSKSMFALYANNDEGINFIKSITSWNILDYIIPVRLENKLKLILFINQNNRSEIFTKHTHYLSFLQRIFEFIVFSSEKLKTDINMKELFNQTAEKQFSYEMMLKKVEQVNEAYNKLQEKQQQLIESERWISLSQISVTLNHEINNPLTLILGLAQFIQVKVKKDANFSVKDFKNDLILIYEQCERIVQIIKSLRKISVPVIEKYLPNIEMIKLDINTKG